MRRFVVASVVCLSACAARSSEVQLDWDMSARYPTGLVEVLPVLNRTAGQSVDREEILAGVEIDPQRRAIRYERTADVGLLPDSLQMAFPGEIQVQLGDTWEGRFTTGHWRLGARDRVAAAIERGQGLDSALSTVARPGVTTLVTWVEELHGAPITKEAFPGEVVTTAQGPVVVDFWDEPYRVTARIGVALVASDGEVVVRYASDYEALLSSRIGPTQSGRALARDLSEDVVLLWPVDPEVAIAADLR